MPFADFSTGQLFLLLVHYPLQIAAVLTLAVLVFRYPIANRWAWGLTVASLAATVGLILLVQLNGCDFQVFWLAGRANLAGANPYEQPLCLWPPQVFALFTLLGLMPLDTAWAVCVWFNAVSGACLVLLTYAILRGTMGSDRLSAPTLGVLTSVMLLSVACRYGMDEGQCSILVILMVLLAMYGWIHQRPVLAGVCLAVACIKPATMLPMLLFFGKRSHWKTWAALVVAGFGLYFVAHPPLELLDRLGACLHNIRQADQPGHVNDYTLNIGSSLITLPRALYYSGIDDRDLVKVIHFAFIGVMSLYLAWRILGPKPWSAAAACSLVACFSTLFLYHRVYDLPLLVVPLVYATGRALHEAGWTRWLYTGSVLAVVGALFIRIEPLYALHGAALSPNPPPQWFLALVMPHAVWLILLAFGFLAAAERWRRQEEPAVAESAVAYQRIEVFWPDRLHRAEPAGSDLADTTAEKKL